MTSSSSGSWTPWMADFCLASLEQIRNNPNQSSRSGGNHQITSKKPKLVQILSRGGEFWTQPHKSPSQLAWLVVTDGQFSVLVHLSSRCQARIWKQYVAPEGESNHHTPSTQQQQQQRFRGFARGQVGLWKEYSIQYNRPTSASVENSSYEPVSSIHWTVEEWEWKPGLQYRVSLSNRIPSIFEHIPFRRALQHLQETQPQQDNQPANDTMTISHTTTASSRLPPSQQQKEQEVVIGDPSKAVKDPKLWDELFRLANQAEQDSSDAEDSSGWDDDSDRHESLTPSSPDQPMHIQDMLATQDQGESPNPASPDAPMQIQDILATQDIGVDEDDKSITPTSLDRPVHKQDMVATQGNDVDEDQDHERDCSLLQTQPWQTSQSPRPPGTNQALLGQKDDDAEDDNDDADNENDAMLFSTQPTAPEQPITLQALGNDTQSTSATEETTTSSRRTKGTVMSFRLLHTPEHPPEAPSPASSPPMSFRIAKKNPALDAPTTSFSTSTTKAIQSSTKKRPRRDTVTAQRSGQSDSRHGRRHPVEQDRHRSPLSSSREGSPSIEGKDDVERYVSHWQYFSNALWCSGPNASIMFRQDPEDERARKLLRQGGLTRWLHRHLTPSTYTTSPHSYSSPNRLSHWGLASPTLRNYSSGTPDSDKNVYSTIPTSTRQSF